MAITWNDVVTIGLAVISVLGFALGRKDKTEKNTETTSYKQGQLDQQLKNIMEKLDKIEKKLDNYDTEIDNKIEKAINNHITHYHNKGVVK